MNTRRLECPIRMAGLLLAVALVSQACAPQSETTSETEAAPEPTAAAASDEVVYEKGETYEPLFVHTAPSIRYADGKLTLESVGDMTLYFSDRPQRIAGWMATADLMEDWAVGDNSFAQNPPNADLSIIQGEDFLEVVVVLKNPKLIDGDLVYDVEMLEGEMPAAAGATTVFIDPGPVVRQTRRVARRTARRTTRRVERRHDRWDYDH